MLSSICIIDFEAIVRWCKAGSALEPLDDLTDEEIATKLLVHLRYGDALLPSGLDAALSHRGRGRAALRNRDVRQDPDFT
ncbi:hypothetical protein [Rhizobium leguminosarum]|uniref:hypothetical protein n=1 Tax=Rhizobium leguminosarum TaxID=384 RepID=UPI0013AF97D2|nr:hypothetical protein [Rhizobium leguminosarum]